MKNAGWKTLCLLWLTVLVTLLAAAGCGSAKNTATSCAPNCPSVLGAAGAAGATAGSGAGAAAGMGASGSQSSAGSSGAAGSSGSGSAGAGGVSADAGSAGSAGGGSGSGGAGGAGGSGGAGPGPGTPPPGTVSDYGAMGPFPVMTMTGSGPDGMYTMVRPTTLGENGFKHPIATWGNGITTTPSYYPGLLNTIASHGFVIIASDSSNVTAALMTTGLDWLIKQNDAGGMFEGKLDVKRAASIGYSLGGGAAVTAGNHPNVMVTVSMHGLTGMAAGLHGPLLLFTSVMDTFVGHAMFVDPNYKASSVQTFYATLVGAGDNGHLTPVGDAGPERAPMVAWLRLWVYGDQGGKKYFYGDDCILCKDPWGPPQDTTLMFRKNWK